MGSWGSVFELCLVENDAELGSVADRDGRVNLSADAIHLALVQELAVQEKRQVRQLRLT